jgi:hypothetical protein
MVGMEVSYEVNLWWMWRNNQPLPTPSVFQLSAKYVATMMMIEQEVMGMVEDGAFFPVS